jgi:hypothetical protein
MISKAGSSSAGSTAACHPAYKGPLSGNGQSSLYDRLGREVEREFVAEAVWKVAGLVVFGIEPEIADGGLR